MQMKKLISVGLVSILALTSVSMPILAEDLNVDTKEVENKHGKKKRSKEDVSLPENAISKDEAKEKALGDANLTKDQVDKLRSRVTSLQDGTVIYKVSFIYENHKYSYQIDAVSGNIINKTNKEVTESTETKHSKPKRGEESKVELPENAISKDEAKEKVLVDANLTLEQVNKVKSRVSTKEDGTVIYKVSFKYENQKYKYQVDALTGNILDKTVEEINNLPAE